jgi:hypothetical protein
VEHKLEAMVNIKDKTCQDPSGCRKQPAFGLQTDTRPSFCVEHKLEAMVNIRCRKTPTVRTLCHSCSGEHGNVWGTYSTVDTDGSFAGTWLPFCMTCYPDRAVVASLNRECRYCDIAETVFVCSDCRRRNHRKEYEVLRELRKHVNLQAVADRRVSGEEGCSNRRPDVFYEAAHNHVVIVEVDEQQHSSSGDSCECARISEIVGAIGGRAVTFIRFNPDAFSTSDRGEDGQAACKRRGQAGRAERLATLVRTVKTHLNTPVDAFRVVMVQLFYSTGVNGSDGERFVREEDITSRVAC